jgi:hypothetical protein
MGALLAGPHTARQRHLGLIFLGLLLLGNLCSTQVLKPAHNGTTCSAKQQAQWIDSMQSCHGSADEGVAMHKQQKFARAAMPAAP